jgi:predicted GIY-YIG superfamily endonuclease
MDIVEMSQIVETDKKEEEKEQWFCYILRNKNPRYSHLTYNGSTNNPKRRLRQHNEEISGGAKYTHGRGGGWEIYCLLTGFPDHKNALSCEWRIKHTEGKPGKRPPHHCGVVGRIVAMNDILHLDKWTKQCAHQNSDFPMKLYLSTDVQKYVHLENLPVNITFSGEIPVIFS